MTAPFLTEPLLDPCVRDNTKTSRASADSCPRRPHGQGGETDEGNRKGDRPRLHRCAGARGRRQLAAVIVGTTGDDRLVGTADVRTRSGRSRATTTSGSRGGDDTVGAGSGDDTTEAGTGNDEVVRRPRQRRFLGRAGNDRLEGGSGDDRLSGGEGNDKTAGGPGDDVVAGRDENDSLVRRLGRGQGVAAGRQRQAARARARRPGRLARLRARPRHGDHPAHGAEADQAGRLRAARASSRQGRLDDEAAENADTDQAADSGARPSRAEGLATVSGSFTTRSPDGHHSAAPGIPGIRHDSYRMAKVLIIEDDDVIAAGHGAPPAMRRASTPSAWRNGETGLARLRYERPDVCVLDLMLPGLDGWSVIEQARGEGIGTPIVVVSARGTEHDRVHALEIGADDYLVKPFSMKELVARVGAAARRGTRGRPRARRRDRDRGAPPRPARRPGVRRRRQRGAHADRVPAALRACARAGPRRSRGTSCSSASGAAGPTHRDRTVDVFVRKLREKIDRRAPRTRSSRRVTASATSSSPSRSSESMYAARWAAAAARRPTCAVPAPHRSAARPT